MDDPAHEAARWVGSEPLPARHVEHHHGRPVLVYDERARTFTELLSAVAAGAPDQLALVFEDRRWTYRQLLDEARAVAGGLRARHGIGAGDRVAALTGNVPEFVVLAVATALLGAILVPLNTRLTATELRFMLVDSGTRILVVTPEQWAKLADGRDGFPELAEVYVADGPAADGTRPFAELLGAAPLPGPPVPVDEDDGIYLCYTSGTTGQPKGVVCTHLGLVHTIRNFELVAGLDARDATLLALPIFHITGLAAQMATFLALGATVVLQRLPLRAGPTLAAIEAHRVTHLFGVPTAFIMLLQHEDHARRDLASLRIVASGGAPLPPDVVRAWSTAYPRTAFLNFYGLTETTSPATWLPDAMKLERAGSAGVPLPVTELRVVDEGGADVEDGAIGELAIRGPMVFPGYWRADERTAEAFLEGGWFRTGDLVRRDPDGFVAILDRAKDMINRAGEKVYSAEVENVLHAHPGVLEAAVIGLADPFYGERVHAVVVARPGRLLTVEMLEAQVASVLADYKRPTGYTFVDSLPRNPGGKVVKHELRRQLEQATPR